MCILFFLVVFWLNRLFVQDSFWPGGGGGEAILDLYFFCRPVSLGMVVLVRSPPPPTPHSAQPPSALPLPLHSRTKKKKEKGI